MKYLVTLEIDVNEDDYNFGLPNDPSTWAWTDLIGDETICLDVREA